MVLSPRRLLLLLVASVGLGSCDSRPAGPNILLITLDTTRRDHLGCYGYQRDTSPNLDRLAADSIVYTNAYAVSSWTLPTHASLFTGKLPSAHGAEYDPEGPLKLTDGIQDGPWQHYRARPIAENETTLAQILTAEGYATGGVAGGPWMKTPFRLQKGFEFYDDENVTALNGRAAEDVTRVALEFIDRHADEPFFLFLNYYDPHSPYFDPAKKPGYRPEFVRQVCPLGVDPGQLEQGELQRLLYDAEIAYADHHLGRLLDHLRARGLYENTWIFVTADHGELQDDPVLGDKGLWGHGNSLSQAEIHIPLFVKEPGRSGRKGPDDRMVQQTDVLPTILERLGLSLPPNIQGTPLGQRHPIVAEAVTLPFMSDPERTDWRHQGDWRVVIIGKYKYGWSSNGTPFLIDLEADPGEHTNLVTSDPARAQEMESLLLKYLAQLPEPGAVGQVGPVDEETMKSLRGLGYTGD